ncbi:MAG: GTP cyclohydrolase II [Myxococcota bacterium]
MLPDDTNDAFERLRQDGRVRSIPIPVADDGILASHSHGDSALQVVGPVPLPMLVGDREVTGRWYVAAPSSPGQRTAAHSEHLSVIAFGEPESAATPPLVRVHSTCFTGDVLGSLRCDCGPQLQLALRQMTESPSGGMVVYMSAHEGRAIGLWSKAAAYLLQDEGLDTYEANRKLGFLDDQRDFRHAAALIKDLLGERPFHLLTNNPDKVQQMRDFGLPDVIQQTHVAGVCSRNRRYISAKRDHGHEIPASALACCD